VEPHTIHNEKVARTREKMQQPGVSHGTRLPERLGVRIRDAVHAEGSFPPGDPHKDS
jgi:hypothetical protein